jgi:hypothetical protein
MSVTHALFYLAGLSPPSAAVPTDLVALRPSEVERIITGKRIYSLELGTPQRGQFMQFRADGIYLVAMENDRATGTYVVNRAGICVSTEASAPVSCLRLFRSRRGQYFMYHPQRRRIIPVAISDVND